MIMLKVKCPKCGKLMIRKWISVVEEPTYTQFEIHFCPYCIKLDDKVEATCWARTESKDKLKEAGE